MQQYSNTLKIVVTRQTHIGAYQYCKTIYLGKKLLDIQDTRLDIKMSIRWNGLIPWASVEPRDARTFEAADGIQQRVQSVAMMHSIRSSERTWVWEW